MKRVKKQVLRAVEVVTGSTASEWPPFCAGIFHQPKRPDGKKRKQF